MTDIKVILPAGDIPLGSTVTKIQGTKQYCLRDQMRLFTEQGRVARVLHADQGTVLLVCDGDANAISGTTEVIWHVTREAFQRYLDRTPQ